MVTTETCAYCKKSGPALQRLNSTELLEFMKQHDKNYTRATKFCKTCRDRMIVKFQQRKLKQRMAAKRASTSAENRTGSYSNYSNPALSSLSQSISESSSQSPTKKRPRSDDRPSRNMAKRTGGRPLNRAGEQQQSSESSSSSMAYPDVPSTQTSTNENQSSGQAASQTRRRTRSQGPTIELDIELDDGNNDIPNQSGTGTSSSQSMQAAPMPHHRTQRTESFTRPPTPERMSNMTAAKRAQIYRTYNRGSGG